MGQQYKSEEFKKSIVKKLLNQGNKGINALSRDFGIPRRTISDWREKYKYDILGEVKPEDNSPANWNDLEKLNAVLEAEKLSEDDFGKWIRERGLHSEHLDLWKEELREMAKNSKKNNELKLAKLRIKELERDLNKKNKALAEVSALLVLKKKAELLWGEEEN